LDVGDSSFAGFFSDGELYTDVNEVAIFDLNEAVLGSLTVLGDGALGGSLVTGAGMPTDTHSHFLIEQGKNVIGRGLIEGHFKNHGRVHGDGFATLDERIVFGPGWTVSGKGSFVNTLVQGFFNPGDSPTIATGENQGYGGEAVVIIELGGTEPGSGDDNHDQIRDDATIWLYDGPTLSIEPWLDFVPQIGDEFVIMTWQTGLSGSFGEEIVDPWFAGHGIGFQFEYNNVGGPGNLTLVAVPEPSTFVLAAVGLLGIVLCVRRRRRDG